MSEASKYVLVPIEALKWLHGEGPDKQGRLFEAGQKHYPPVGKRYWWRDPFLKWAVHGEPATFEEIVEVLEQCLGNFKGLQAENGWGAAAARTLLAKLTGET